MTKEDEGSVFAFATVLAKNLPVQSVEEIAALSIALTRACNEAIAQENDKERKLLNAYRAAQANDAKPEPGTGAQTVAAPGYKRRTKRSA